MLTDPIARQASESALKTIQQNDARRVHVTLVGGPDLNPGADGQARPVQACVYLVRVSQWTPPAIASATECMTPQSDANVLAFARRVVGPNRVEQVQLAGAESKESWVVVDADFSRHVIDYVPLKLSVKELDGNFPVAWLGATRIHNPLQRAVADAGSESKAAPAALTQGKPNLRRRGNP